MSARPATAGTAVTFGPDAKIAVGTDPQVGENVYSADGHGQTVTKRVPRGRTVLFALAFQNDGSSFDTITIFGCPVHGRHDGYSVAYFDGPTDVSSQMRTGVPATLAPGDEKTLQLRMRIHKDGLVRKRECLTHATSGVGADTDAVVAVIKQR